MARPGVYSILNAKNGKFYIGSSLNWPRRVSRHKWMLRTGRHESGLLQGAWDRDGEGAFNFSLIESCTAETLLAREQLWINVLRSSERRYGYNVCEVAGTKAGVPASEYCKQRSSDFHLGRPKSEEHKARIREASFRRWSDPEERMRQSKRNFGKQKRDYRKLPDDQVAALRADRAAGVTYVQLQKKYGRGAGSIFSIIHGINYRE